MRTGRTNSRSTVLSGAKEAIVVGFRRHTLLPLDDSLYALQATIPPLNAFLAAPLSAAAWNRRSCRQRRQQACKEEVQTYPIGFFQPLHKINDPWTNGHVERMNRTIKDATVNDFTTTIAISYGGISAAFVNA